LPPPAPDSVPQQAALFPTGAAPPTIQPESVKRVKKATVQLKVKLSDGSSAEGSGFFATEPGIVLTNAHVLGMLRANAKPPQKIEVVAQSGQADEFTMTGKVVGVDRDNDLAAVRVEGEQARWPAPLPVELDMSNLTELQKVYVFGFPLGSSLGKEITASDSSISSFRRGADGSLYQIQVNGGIQPGNSGGPVVDTRGVVVGVAVALISGTQINFVVPGEKVLGIVNGRVQETRLGQPYREMEQIKLPVKVAFLDPLRRIRAVEVEIWTGPAGKQRPGSLKPPAALAGDGQRQTVALAYQDGAATLDVVLPTLALPAGQVYWLQPVFVNKSAVKQWGTASSYRPAGAPPLERVPANLTSNLAAGERSLKLSSKSTLQLSKGREKIVEADIMNMEVLEAVESNPTGAGIKLRWGKGQFFEELNGKRLIRRPAAYAAINSHVHGFQCDPKGALTSFGFVKFNLKDPRTSEEANDMANHFLTSYQFVSLPMPNRVVQPLETWDAKIRLMMGREKQKDVMDVVLTCTYEGSRKVQDKTEALISLTGEIIILKSARPLIRNPSDRVGGQALFDVDGGRISNMTIALNDERDLGGVVLTRAFEANVTRAAGNTFGIQMPAPKSNPPAAKPQGAIAEQPRTSEKSNAAVLNVIPGDMFAYLRQAVADKRTTQVDIKGFTQNKSAYQDACEDGGVLIGFQVGLGKFGKNSVIDSFRPIYLTSSGEKMGPWFGKASAQPVTTKAKTGYVVGAIDFRAGLGIDGLSLKFMKLDNGQLQVQDTYDGEWIGGKGGNPSKIGGTGVLAVGICGHLNNQGKPTSLGLVAVVGTKK
jgi:hypothetical protein